MKSQNRIQLKLIGVRLSLGVLFMGVSLPLFKVKIGYTQSHQFRKGMTFRQGTKGSRYRVRKGKAGLRWVKVPRGRINQDHLQLDLTQNEERKMHSKSKKWIKVSSFLMSQTEVTVAQYRHCVQAKVCPKPDSFLLDDQCTWSDHPEKNENKPLNCISRENALIFAKWAGGLLPSHAQWYHAVRKGRLIRKKEPTLQHLTDQEWLGRTEEEGPFDVAQKQPNRLGIYDLLGNVSELVILPKTHLHQEEDVLPCGCESIYFRGGMWAIPLQEVNESIWNGVNIDRGLIGVGFRLVKPL